METSKRFWKVRYDNLEEIETQSSKSVSSKISIQYYICDDLFLNQKVMLKKIQINESQEIRDLARFLWHYEISLNHKAINNTDGRTLLKLIDAQYDAGENCFIIVTESGGVPLIEMLKSKKTNEDYKTIKSFLSDKKKTWNTILKLVEGLSSLHKAGLIHRNLSLSSIYFDVDGYRQGEREVLKIGDFNWSIYLYSIGNIFTDNYMTELVQDRVDLFRDPKCIPQLNSDEEDYCGENIQSDLFSLGLVFAFLLTDIKIEDYENTEIDERVKRIEEIRERISAFKRFIPEERILLIKLTEVDPQKQFQNSKELLIAIKDVLNKIEFNWSHTEELPLHFQLSRENLTLKIISNHMKLGIDAILSNQNEFFRIEFENSTLYLLKNREFPLWVKGRSGLEYRIQKFPNKRNLANIYILRRDTPTSEKTNHAIQLVDRFIWKDPSDNCSYYDWEGVFASAYDALKAAGGDMTQQEKDREEWLMGLDIISDAEDKIEQGNIFEYQLIDTSNEEDSEEEDRIVITISNLINKNFPDKLQDMRYTEVELIPTINLFESFEDKRKWKIFDIDDDDDRVSILTLTRDRKGEKPPTSGYLRFWEMINTLTLLRRKHRIIKNLNKCNLLINALLFPGPTHQYFERDESKNVVSNIFNTYPIFLLQGPPGTGKTWTAKELIKKTLSFDPYSKILVTSKEHFALDDLLVKTTKGVSELDLAPPPYLIRLISPEKERSYHSKLTPFRYFTHNIAKEILRNISRWEPADETLIDLRDQLNEVIAEELESPSREWIDLTKMCSNLIFSTTTSGDLIQLLYDLPHFDLVVIEEAGKCYPSELLLPLQLGNKWVLIGDQNQLPPFRIEDIGKILEEIFEDREIELKETLEYTSKEFINLKKQVEEEMRMFQSMFNRFQKMRRSFDKGDLIKSCDTLTDQYRLPSKINRMISRIFYGREFTQVKPDPPEGAFIQKPDYLVDQQLVWIKTPFERAFRESRSGKNIFNVGEAQLISKLLNKIVLPDDLTEFSLAILTPYNEQVQVLQNTLPRELPNLRGIKLRENCFTIDSFQGKEADLIIISLVRNNTRESPVKAWGFVPQLERLNVMFSRVRKAEIIVGNLDMVKIFDKEKIMEKFVQIAKFVEEEGRVIPAREVL